MQFIHPSIQMETSNSAIQEFMNIIERAGRTCWKSEAKQYSQALKYIEDPSFEPEGYKDHSIPATLEDLMDPQFIRTVRDDKAFSQVTQDFNLRLVKVGHTSVLEHSAITVRIITDRALSHQLVRHRIGAYSQKSQRYVDDDHVAFIIPENSGLEPGYFRWSEIPKSLSKIHMETPQPDGAVRVSFVDISNWSKKGMPQSWVRAMHYAEKFYKELRDAGVKKQDARSVLPNAAQTEIVATFNIHMWRHVLEKRLHPSAQHDIRKIMTMILDKFLETPMAILFKDFKNE